MDMVNKNGPMGQNMKVFGLIIKYTFLFKNYFILKNKKVHGRGVFFHIDGDIYMGDFENDKMHGIGVF